MELQKGTCFICGNKSVIKSSQSQKAYKVMTLLLPKDILDPTEFNNVQSALRVCPICYHKLIIMKRISKNVEKNTSNEISEDHCLLCKNEKNLFQMNNWPSFSAISEDMAIPKKKNCVMCSDCLFYLETRNQLKTKLFLKCPQLDNKSLTINKNKRKWKLKFTPNIKLQSTPLSEKNKRSRISRKRKFLDTISVSSDDDLEPKKVLNPFKKLKPLKDYKLYKNNKMVKTDSKFLNQIPYVLVNNSNLFNIHNDTFSEDAVTKYTAEAENENFKVRDEDTILVTLRNELVKHGIEKQLVVNVSRMKMGKYKNKGRRESDPDIQNLIDKFSILQSSNRTEENASTNVSNSSLIERQESFVEETEMSFEIKNKRKSVSFADDKNVEIEYFENNRNAKLKYHNNLDENSEVIGKKHSKGILKREENVEEKNNTLEEQNEDVLKETEVELEPDKSFNKAVNESEEDTQNQENKVKDEASKIKIKSRRNSYLIDENTISLTSDSESDSESLSQILKESKQDSVQEETGLKRTSENEENNLFEDENIKHGGDKVTEKNKAKPLSKKKRNTIAEDTNVDNSDDNHDLTTAEQSLQNETKPDEKNVELVSVDEKLENKVAKRERPKPLSKKKKINVDKSEDKDIQSGSDLDISKDNEAENKSVSEDRKVKKYKPRPLSKKKKFDDKCENTMEEINFENNLNSSKDEGNVDDSDKEKSNAESISSGKNIQGGSNDIEEQFPLRNDSQVEHGQNTDEIDEADKPTEDNEVTNSETTAEKGKDSLNSTLEDKASADNSNISECCEEVLTEDDADTINKDTKNHATDLIDSNKPDAISDTDVTQLVNKYLNNQDENDGKNTQKTDTLEESTNLSFSQSSDDNKVDSDGKIGCDTVDEFNEFEKTEDLGISEVDNDNINSILSNMFPSELPDDKLFETKNENKTETDPTEETNGDLKRKMSDDELNTSKEKKKKKVTFYDDT
ncbi:probable ATP-dependent helicase PF08_0048 [Anoplophora glabripennis]|uniref:probable ATP-dependent helicase PF08_0048 n=1 Tax=Anoplophora glabripennis TaxID=217634 RepID=UPI000873B3A0|nr:probable ATP-dependent helicase PF08_0048 [Anoplophora glabripennis]